MLELTTLLTPILDQLMNKVITLISGKIKIALEIKDFSFGQMTTAYEENGFYNSLLVLLEVTNNSEKPYHISSFSMKFGDSEFVNLFILESERKMMDGNLIDISQITQLNLGSKLSR